MSTRNLPMMLRAYPAKRVSHQARKPPEVKTVLVFDVETDTELQRLLFGSVMRHTVKFSGSTVDMSEPMICLFYADDLPKSRPETYAALKRYAQKHGPHVDLMPRTRFVQDIFLPAAIRETNVITGFNVSFDIWSLAVHIGHAGGGYYGGLSGQFVSEDDDTPDIFSGIRYREIPAGIGMKREFTFYRADKRIRTCQVVDSSQLSRALTGNRHTLLSAGQAAGCQTLKYDGKEIHDPEVNSGLKGRQLRELLDHYIGYCVNDTRAAGDLWRSLTGSLMKHPIGLRQSLAFSPASLSKQYFRDLGIHAPLCACEMCRKRRLGGNSIPLAELGRAEVAFYGARSECLIRLTELPAIVVDFTSQYPSAMILMGLWDMLIRERIEMTDVTGEVRELLEHITLDDLYDPDISRRLTVFCDVPADDDVLPFRGPYQAENGAPNIGVNYVTTDQPVTWTLLDVIAAKILSGKIPEVTRAVRYQASGGIRSGLKSLSFNGDERLKFDPAKDNLLRFAIEERARAKKDHKANPSVPGWKEDTNSCLCAACDRANFLKVFANAIFGIFGEMNHKQRPKGKNPGRDSVTDTIYGLGWFECRDPEETGEFCFPPFASLITGYGRLLLAMLQAEVHKAGTEIIFCDTDSGCIPASKNGGETNGIKLLTYQQVDDIREKFNRLNPYDRTAVGEFLKQEWPKDELPALVTGLSAKRYVVYRRNGDRIDVLKKSEHGLGMYANPLMPDPEIDDNKKPDWYSEVWKYIIRTQIDGEELERPDWFNLPAVSMFPIRTRHVWDALASFNRGKPYYQQMRPFGFHLAYHPFEDNGTLPDGSRVHLIASYTSDSGQWEGRTCTDIRSGRIFRTTTELGTDDTDTILVKTYGDVITRYIRHPEIKYDGPDGSPCDYRTRGVLQPCHVIASGYMHITKDTGSIELADLAHDQMDRQDGASYRVYRSDSENVLYTLAKDFYRAHGVGRKKLEDILLISKKQAEMFMSDTLAMPGKDVIRKAVTKATRQAVKELGLRVWPSERQVLAKWTEAYRAGNVTLQPIAETVVNFADLEMTIVNGRTEPI